VKVFSNGEISNIWSKPPDSFNKKGNFNSKNKGDAGKLLLQLVSFS